MGKVLFQTDDALNEANLSEWINHGNLVGYAKEPVINTNFVDNVVQIDATTVWLRDGGGTFAIIPDEATLELPDTTGENFLYATFDVATQDSAVWEVVSDEGNVPTPAVVVAVVDAGEETVTKKNENPDVDASQITANSASVESEPTDDTDVVRKVEADEKADLPIETDDLSDDAVTAAKIAAAAVDSEAISDGAVGVSELAEALGTDAENPISGTTHLESVNMDNAVAAEQLGIPVYSDDTNAPDDTFFYNDEDDQTKYKNPAGSIVVTDALSQSEVEDIAIKFAVAL